MVKVPGLICSADLARCETRVRCTHFASDSARHAVSLSSLEAGFATHALPLVPRFFVLLSNTETLPLPSTPPPLLCSVAGCHSVSNTTIPFLPHCAPAKLADVPPGICQVYAELLYRYTSSTCTHVTGTTVKNRLPQGI